MPLCACCDLFCCCCCFLTIWCKRQKKKRKKYMKCKKKVICLSRLRRKKKISKKEKTSCSIHSSFQTHTICCLYIPRSVPSYCSVAITLHLSFLLTHHLPISFTFSFDSLCSILIPFSVLLPPCSWCGRGSSGEGGGLLLETALNNTFLLTYFAASLTHQRHYFMTPHGGA